MSSKQGFSCYVLCAIVLLQSACSASSQSSSEQTSPSENTSTGVVNEPVKPVALTSGGSCSEHLIPAEDSTESETNSDEFFECGEITPDTTIDIQGVSFTGDGSITRTALASTPDIASETSLNGAAVVVFPHSAFTHHSGIRLYLHNGELRIAEKRYQQKNNANETIVRHKVDWGIYNGSIVFSVVLASASQSSFEGGTFESIGTQNPNKSELIGTDMLVRGIVYQDHNDSESLDATDEIAQMVSGNISIAGSRPNWVVSIDVLLDNDETISGYFNGDYIEIPTADASSH